MSLESLFQEIKNLKKNSEKIYIYGAGSYGCNLFQILKRHSIDVDGFVISGKPDESTHEIPVYQATRFFNKKVGYILALNARNAAEVQKYLLDNEIDSKYIINAGKYMEQFGEKRGMRAGSIEITMSIGCRVNCRYCPQSLLLSKYFENNKDRECMMSKDTFVRCLEFFPKEYDISFGGMSEPFLNDNFVDMLKIACEYGRRISLYTTLVGAEEDALEKILELPLEFVVLHVADQCGYAHIPLTESYYKNVERIINARRGNGKPFVNMCNAQAEPDERIKKICDGKYEIFTKMTDRAGNLEGAELIRNSVNRGKIRCGNMGEELNNNILLPDGTVILCCMDFGLKHVLGNIYENSFDEIMQGQEIVKVKEGMAGKEDIDILCRKCSYARGV